MSPWNLRYGSSNSNSVKNAKNIATSINEQVKKDVPFMYENGYEKPEHNI